MSRFWVALTIALLGLAAGSPAAAQARVEVAVRVGSEPRFQPEHWRYRDHRYDDWRWSRYGRHGRARRGYTVPTTQCVAHGRWVRCRTVEVVVEPPYWTHPPRHPYYRR